MSMAVNDYICNLDSRMLLQVGGFVCSPPVLAMGQDNAVGSTAPTFPGVGLVAATDEDRWLCRGRWISQ